MSKLGLGSEPRLRTSSKPSKRIDKGDPRVAVIIPYLGKNLPPYFDLFKFAASGSSSLVDFLIFLSSETEHIANQNTASLPSNVKFIDVGGVDKMAEIHARVATVSSDGSKRDTKMSQTRLVSTLAAQFNAHPYTLVEFKPAYGHIFQNYIKDYSHWGYADLDMIFGDLVEWISPDELNDFDITTYGHGDQASVYLRGQFTFHRNNELVNNVWRNCEHLSKLDERYTGGKNYRFESAEGCYSHAVLQRDDIKVKYAVKAMTDFNKEDSAHRHGIMLVERQGGGLVLYKAGVADKSGGMFRALDSETLYPERMAKGGLYWDVGEMEEVVSYKDTPDNKLPNRGRGCMFWAPTTYQRDICVHEVDENYTIKFINGKLFKQKWEKFSFPNGVVSAPFFHFQEWKRKYRVSQFAGLGGVVGGGKQFLLMTEGLADFGRVDANGGSNDLAKLEEGKVSRGELRYPLPANLYCSNFESVRADNDGKKTVHCLDYISWLDGKTTDVITWPTDRRSKEGVTLSIVLSLQDLGWRWKGKGKGKGKGQGQVSKRRVKLAMQSINAWTKGPVVFIIHSPEAENKAAVLALLESQGVNAEGNVLCAVVTGVKYNRKSLLNMANDAVRTRFVVVNVNPERGMVLGGNVADIVHKTAELGGGVLLLPHFVVHGEAEARFHSFAELEGLKTKGRVKLFSEPFCREGDDEESTFSELEQTWWKGGGAADSAASKVVEAMLKGDGGSLFRSKLQPVLLLDRQGPRKGILTDLVARHVEELDGDHCYNFMQLASLLTLGYKFGVLGGVFIVSTGGSAGEGVSCMECSAVKDEKNVAEIVKARIKVTANTARGGWRTEGVK